MKLLILFLVIKTIYGYSLSYNDDNDEVSGLWKYFYYIYK